MTHQQSTETNRFCRTVSYSRYSAKMLVAPLISVALMSIAAAAHSAELRLTVDGIRSEQGKVMVALHAPKSGVSFPNGAGAVAAQWRAARNGALEFVFTELPAGRFAIAVFHDENGALDTNMLGIPKEGYAFSENARGFAGPPSFDAAAVEINDADTK